MAGNIKRLQSVFIVEPELAPSTSAPTSSTRFLLEIWEIGPSFFGYLSTPESRFYFLREIGFSSAAAAFSAACDKIAAIKGSCS